MTLNLPLPARIVVVGTSASGKSTFSKRLAAILALPRFELDDLFWDAGWKPKPNDEFVRLIDQATNQPQWVVDGNYGAIRQRLWPKANLIIWLNYSRTVVLWRGLKRTIGRCLTRQELWHGNRESFRRSFMSRDSILLWIWNTHRLRIREYQDLRDSNSFAAAWIEFRNPSQAEEWLCRVKIVP